MEHEKMTKSHGLFFFISHGIVPVLSPNCTNFLWFFFATTKKLNIDVESPQIPTFSANQRECKINRRDGHGKLRNGHGEVMDKYFVNYVGVYRCIYSDILR